MTLGQPARLVGVSHAPTLCDVGCGCGKSATHPKICQTLLNRFSQLRGLLFDEGNLLIQIFVLIHEHAVDLLTRASLKVPGLELVTR